MPAAFYPQKAQRVLGPFSLAWGFKSRYTFSMKKLLISAFLLFFTAPVFCQIPLPSAREISALEEGTNINNILSIKYRATREEERNFEIELDKEYILPAGSSAYTFILPLKEKETFYYTPQEFPFIFALLYSGETAQYKLDFLNIMNLPVFSVKASSTLRQAAQDTDISVRKTITFTKERDKDYWNSHYIYAQIRLYAPGKKNTADLKKIRLGEILLNVGPQEEFKQHIFKKQGITI